MNQYISVSLQHGFQCFISINIIQVISFIVALMYVHVLINCPYLQVNQMYRVKAFLQFRILNC